MNFFFLSLYCWSVGKTPVYIPRNTKGRSTRGHDAETQGRIIKITLHTLFAYMPCIIHGKVMNKDAISISKWVHCTNQPYNNFIGGCRLVKQNMSLDFFTSQIFFKKILLNLLKKYIASKYKINSINNHHKYILKVCCFINPPSPPHTTPGIVSALVWRLWAWNRRSAHLSLYIQLQL